MRFVLSLLLTAFILTGCRTPQPPPLVLDTPDARDAAWQQQQKTLASLTQWQTAGKIGIKHQNKGQSARWSWQHQDPHLDTITLSGPLNQGTVILVRDANKTTLTNAKGQIHHSHDTHKLLLEATGWSLPVNSLYYWVRGLPDPSLVNHVKINDYGALAVLDQGTWHIEYPDYQFTAGYWLPRKISIHREETEITLILNTWELSS